jgi:hypothetical protein
VKLTDHTYTYNNLTNFTIKLMPPETEIDVNLVKFAMKKLVKLLLVNLFLAGFSHLETLCAAGGSRHHRRRSPSSEVIRTGTVLKTIVQ